MAKKHLLYIHVNEFEAEEKKSDLVNGLLGEHYGTTFQKKKPGRKPKSVVLMNGVDPLHRVDLTEVANLKGIDLCTHAAAQGLCKVKGCPHTPRVKNDR